jgi:peptidoglycan/LPS O-acetylase OafA/YrhL
MGSRSSGRILQFDGLRAFAFGSVFLQHAFHVPLLWMGVDCFFVLSGFLITGILARQRGEAGAIKIFYWKRARRILPPYCLALAIVALTLGISWSTDWPYLAFFTANFGIAFHHVKTGSLSPLWSLSVEEHFYLLWPFLILFLSRRRSIQMAVGILIIAPILRGICTPLFSTHFPIYFLTPFRADLLAAGALLALTLNEHQQRWRSLSKYMMVAGGCGIAFLAAFGFKTNGNTATFNVLSYESSLVFFTGVIAFLAPLQSGITYRVLTLKPLRYIGTISYLAYLIHQPMLLLIHSRLLAFAATLAICALSWELMEKRLIAFSQSKRKLVTEQTACNVTA